MTTRKTNGHRRRHGYLLLLLLLVALAVIGCVAANRIYQAHLRAAYAARVETAQTMLAEEKAWIRLNQAENGALYMNHTEADAAGDVNPYFACQAAMGLLAGTPSDEDLAAAGRYLRWHTETLLDARGEIPNQRLTDGTLVSTGERDSVDAYIAVYLMLAAAYDRKGGALAEIPGVDEALDLCAEKLQGLLTDGLTRVSAENDTRYLMDNAEVMAACRDTAALLTRRGDTALAQTYTDLARTVEAGIRDRLWQPEADLYLVGLAGRDSRITADDWETFYPDALAQLFPILCDAQISTAAEDAARYQMFCDAFAWEALELGDSDFPWACIACVAVAQGDCDRAETYLAAFRTRYAQDRDYPFHTAEAGWAARACADLLEVYSERQHRSLWDALVESL